MYGSTASLKEVDKKPEDKGASVEAATTEIAKTNKTHFQRLLKSSSEINQVSCVNGKRDFY